MSHLNRREFLSKIAVGISAATLSACAPKVLTSSAISSPQTPETFSPPLTANPSDIDSPDNQLAEPTPVENTNSISTPSMAYPHMVIARHGSPQAMVGQALAALGGIERFVPPGADVIIKPNICVAYHTYEYAATTNPWVVGSLVSLCVAAGAKRVRVTDYPFGGTPQEAYVRTGIQEQVHAAGGEMLVMPNFSFIPTDIPAGLDLKNAAIFNEALSADVLINVPVAKDHGLARLTLGMKNLMGLIYDRPAIHRNIGQRLSDLTSLLKPTLTIIDAVRMLMDNGPTGGSLNDVKQADTIIASPDIVAADSYGATLFGMLPGDLSYVTAGTAMGLGRSDLENMNIEEIFVNA